MKTDTSADPAAAAIKARPILTSADPAAAAIKARPILFSAPMVRAILGGHKTQTRRIVKPQPTHFNPARVPRRAVPAGGPSDVIACPHGQAGDQLWVRETHAIVPRTAYRCSDGVQQVLRPDDDHDAAIYREGWTRSNGGFRWRPSIHMPRWASRITLEITGVRVERLQDVTAADAIAEGVERTVIGEGWRRYHTDQEQELAGLTPCADPVSSYRSLWESINGPNAWAANPFVWVVEFKRLEQTP